MPQITPDSYTPCCFARQCRGRAARRTFLWPPPIIRRTDFVMTIVSGDSMSFALASASARCCVRVSHFTAMTWLWRAPLHDAALMRNSRDSSQRQIDKSFSRTHRRRWGCRHCHVVDCDFAMIFDVDDVGATTQSRGTPPALLMWALRWLQFHCRFDIHRKQFQDFVKMRINICQY